MLTLTLQLLKYPGSYEKRRFPIAYIALKSFKYEELPTESGKNKVVYHVISIRCESSSDIENEIKKLIRELEIIKKQGKSFFQKEREKIRKKGK